MPKPLIAINIDYVAGEKDASRGSCRLPSAYADCVDRAGGVPLLVPPLEDPRELGSYLDLADGFILSGGADYPPSWYGEPNRPETREMHPRRAAADRYLAEAILDSGRPLLAICAGIQLVNIVAGGKLVQHVPGHRPDEPSPDLEHGVRVEPESLLSRIAGADELEVNSTHHQAVDPQHLGRELRIVARAEDGTVEAVERDSSAGRFFLAVQWHPERFYDRLHAGRLFERLVEACGPEVRR